MPAQPALATRGREPSPLLGREVIMPRRRRGRLHGLALPWSAPAV